MDTTTPCIEALFAQLGLPNEPHEIRAFITRHRPLDNAVLLMEAPFWNTAQAALIRQKLAADDDWAPIVDTLNTQLREHPDPASMPQG
jgi:hypothetical protein